MEKLSALIVDDEENAVRLLNELLADTRQFSDIRQAYSSSSAKTHLKHFNPDLIFLDIKMPGTNGFALMHDLHSGQISSEVIIVTAFDEFALEAIRNHAFGYLLKPVNRAELSECIEHFKSRKTQPVTLERLGKLLEAFESTRLRINTRAGYFFIDPTDILYCQADGNYSTIQLGDKQHVCSLQLNKVQEELPKGFFIRLGRSLIINFRHIVEVDRKSRTLTFEKDTRSYTLNISKSQLKELELQQR